MAKYLNETVLTSYLKKENSPQTMGFNAGLRGSRQNVTNPYTRGGPPDWRGNFANADRVKSQQFQEAWRIGKALREQLILNRQEEARLEEASSRARMTLTVHDRFEVERG